MLSPMQNNANLFKKLFKDITPKPDYIMISFEVVSLFTNVLINETIEMVLRRHPPKENTCGLMKHYLKVPL